MSEVKSYRIRGFYLSRYLIVSLILVVPAWLFLLRLLKFGIIDPFGAVAFVALLVTFFGFISQIWTNKMLLDFRSLRIFYRFSKFEVHLDTVESVQRIFYMEQMDNLSLNEDETILELDHGHKEVVLITLRSGSSAGEDEREEYLRVKYVTVSPVRVNSFVQGITSRM
jgi:hypothetical protein